MSKPIKKPTREFVLEKVKRVYKEREAIRMKLKKEKIIKFDDTLKNIYRIRN